MADQERRPVQPPQPWGLDSVLIVVLLAVTNARGLFSSQSILPPGAGHSLRQNLPIVRAAVFLTLALLALGYIDSGLAGGALRFSPPDVALLFPAPFSRRLILLFKLPAALSQHLIMIALFAGMFRALVWLPMQQGQSGGGWSAVLAATLCVAGFLNVSILLDLLSGLARRAWIGVAFRVAVVIALVGLTRFLWTHGTGGLLAVGDSRLLAVVFSPCRAAADAAVVPFGSLQLSAHSWVILFGWYGLTLGLLFTRRVNYYEAAALGAERAARVRQAVRSGDWAAMRERPARAGRFTLPAFGRGGGALLWAHLAAAAKRPGFNVALPFFGGLGVGLLVALTTPQLGVGGMTMPGRRRVCGSSSWCSPRITCSMRSPFLPRSFISAPWPVKR